ncbi:MAG: phosphoglycerate kinase [Candidatus Adlerbacteria bacterium]|nr:phosphoglycerate kinase [Candidatus Adlerbacteria bacterium]
MQKIVSVKEADVRGKRVLVRVDFNVPLDFSAGEARIVDDTRIKAALPTLQYVHEQGAAKIIILTHLGRPEGKEVEQLRTAPLAAVLRALVDYPEIEIRENLRFDPREEANDEGFAKELANLGDVFVNEAFPVSHRSDASIVGIPKFLPSYAGLRFIEEIEKLTPALTPPKNSLAIVGGAKFETKQPLIEKLVALYGAVLLGGALANDLLKSRGLPVGASLVSDVPMPTSFAENVHIVAPTDLVVEGTVSRPAHTADVRTDERIVDIGVGTAVAWAEEIKKAEFVLWNGPVGMYEKGFVQGTDALAEALVNSNCRAVIGGGDTAAALAKHTFDPSRIFISTGGGAMLQFLADGTLPGIEALTNSVE